MEHPPALQVQNYIYISTYKWLLIIISRPLQSNVRRAPCRRTWGSKEGRRTEEGRLAWRTPHIKWPGPRGYTFYMDNPGNCTVCQTAFKLKHVLRHLKWIQFLSAGSCQPCLTPPQIVRTTNIYQSIHIETNIQHHWTIQYTTHYKAFRIIFNQLPIYTFT